MKIKANIKNIIDHGSIIQLNPPLQRKNKMDHIFTASEANTLDEIDITMSDFQNGQEYQKHTVKLNHLQKSILKLIGKVYVGDYQKDGWQESLPLYAFKCKEHGVQISYPTGWKKNLKCSSCFRAQTK